MDKKSRIFNHSMSVGTMDETKINKFNNGYEEKNKNRLFPEIISIPIKRDISTNKASINNTNNCFILPNVFKSIQIEKKKKY